MKGTMKGFCRGSLAITTLGFAVAIVVLVATLAAADKKVNTGHRCFRPFGALSAFKPGAMRGTENCMFEYLEVLNATATAECTPGGSTDGGTPGCHVTLALDGQRLRRLRSDADGRYTLELQAVNDSTINYKGFDGNGYSLCCMFLDGSKCEWVPSTDSAPAESTVATGDAPQKGEKHLAVEKCVLTANDDGELTAPLSGSLVKPLHTYTVGKWEAKMIFYHKHETVGRLVVPFELTSEDVANLKQQQHQQEVVAAAATPVDEDVAPTAVVSVDKTADDAAKDVDKADM